MLYFLSRGKLAPPFAKVEFDIMYGLGISREGDVLDLGVKHEIVDKSGAWISYNGERLRQGLDNSKNFLKENPKITEEIRRKVCDLKGLNGTGTPKEAAAEKVEEKMETAEKAPAKKATGKKAPRSH